MSKPCVRCGSDGIQWPQPGVCYRCLENVADLIACPSPSCAAAPGNLCIDAKAEYLPPVHAAELRRLWDADFERWYALVCLMKPILMDSKSVRGLLSGAKQQTRRIVKAPRSKVLVYDLTRAWRDNLGGDDYLHCPFWHVGDGPCPTDETSQRICAPISTGDVLWVRETWAPVEREEDCCDGIRYRADDAFVVIQNSTEAADLWMTAANNDHSGRWRPSIYMPRWAARIFLKVTSVRVQRLQRITSADCLAEGVGMSSLHCDWIANRTAFFARWEGIHGKGSSAADPWVWIYGLERLP